MRRRRRPRRPAADNDDHDDSSADDHHQLDHDDHDHNDAAADDNLDDDTRRPPTTVPPTPATFTDLHDLVPQRCFSAPLSTVDVASVRIGIESGYNSATWQNKACIAATTAFNPRSVSDTFTLTVTAQPGQHITRVHYQQTGSRYLERSLYWRASGTGQLTANGVSVPFSFTLPNVTKTVDLTGQNVESATISVSVSMSAGRSDNQPRVTNPPGSASIIVASAVISVESA